VVDLALECPLVPPPAESALAARICIEVPADTQWQNMTPSPLVWMLVALNAWIEAKPKKQPVRHNANGLL
jgi:hypothetical protein